MSVNIVRAPATGPRTTDCKSVIQIIQSVNPKATALPCQAAAAAGAQPLSPSESRNIQSTSWFSDRPRFARIPHEIRWDVLYAIRRGGDKP